MKKTWDRLAGVGRGKFQGPGGSGGPSPAAPASTVCSVQTALSSLRTYARQNSSKQIHVLVTGSLYLVGDLLRILKRIP